MKVLGLTVVLLFITVNLTNELVHSAKRGMHGGSRSGSNGRSRSRDCNCVNTQEPNVEELSSMTIELFRLLDL